MRYPRWMVAALLLATVASDTALADDLATDRPPPGPAGEGGGRGWKFAAFFDLVKKKVAAEWDPMVAARERDPTGSRYFKKDRKTILAITLDTQGAITEIKVAWSSGLDFLDQTTIDAFKKAQPFLNPPPGLADARGDIRFTFGFNVSTGGGRFRFSQDPASRPPVPALPPGELLLALDRLDEKSAGVDPEAAPFFDRVKAAVKARWKPLTIIREKDPTGSEYFSQDRSLLLAIVLDGKGSISRIEVRKSSGLDFLDQTAIDAIKNAQPFVDPPATMADAQGAISFTFGFRVFRGP